MRNSPFVAVLTGLLAVIAAPAVHAAGSTSPTAPENVAMRTALVSPETVAPARPPGPLVLSAPPRDSAAEGRRIFDPIADYLSTALGRKVVYRHPATWGGYQTDMQAGAYDIAFDGPHFNGWRIAHRGHNVLAKIPGELVYTAVVRKDNTTVHQLKQLAGHKICAHAPPNLGTLVMYAEFDNPIRQPVVIVEDGYETIYRALLKGECEAAMLPLSHVVKYDGNNPQTRIIFRTRPMPQQAFSAGPRIAPAEQARLVAALTSPAATVPLAEFRKTYGFGGNLVPVTNTDYAGLARYLKDEWGYD